MYYDFAITVPANTSESSPVIQDIRLCKGAIRRMEVQFPIGTLALLRCKIFYHDYQAYPTNPDGYFASDGYVIPIDDYFKLDSKPYELKIIAWNLDDTYQHILTVRVGIPKLDILNMVADLIRYIKSFFKLLGAGS